MVDNHSKIQIFKFIRTFYLEIELHSIITQKILYLIRAIILLLVSNVFMTVAWYGHLKHREVSLWKVILVSWGIALVEYCFMVPANRIGYESGITGFQLKLIQEVITLLVFSGFAVWVLREPIKWNHLMSFACLLGAVYFMFKKS